MLILFSLIAAVNIFLFTIVFFSYANVLENDYENKLTSTTRQMASNISRTLSFFEEEIEIFINKYNITENLHSYNLEKDTSIRTDSISFDSIAIFRENTLVYANTVEGADFYRHMMQKEILEEKMKEKDREWIITDNVENVSGENTVLCYVRKIQPDEANRKHGYIVAIVSQKHLVNQIDLYYTDQNGKAAYFKPSFAGIRLEGKNLFLVDDALNIEDAYEENNDEVFNVDIQDDIEFFIARSNDIMNRKIFSILLVFILILIAIILSAYKVLKIILDEISGRINSLNHRMENYSSKDVSEV